MVGELSPNAAQSSTNDGTSTLTRQASVQTSASSEISRLEWPELKTTERYVNAQRWRQSAMPQELHQLPSNISVAEKLDRILAWSSWRNADFPQSVRQSHVSSEEGTASRSTTSGSNIGKQPSVSHDIRRSASIRHALQHPTPQSDKLVSRLRQLRQAMRDPIGLLKDRERSGLSTQPQEAAVSEPGPEPEPRTGECISCFDEHPITDLVHPPCKHDYCKNCLREVIMNAMKNESAFPPKCCLTEIPLKTILQCLDPQQREDYKEKAAEYSIGAGHRWYCPNTTCARWIRPEKLHRNRRAPQICPHCKTKICSHCRATAHESNQTCPQDFGLEATLEIAEAEGWRRCYSCRTMVELTTGCRHITCKCGAQFCYVCNARWRTCSCTEDDKTRRLQELKTRRQQTEQQRREEDAAAAAAAAEAEDIALAIAQVEEMERREAQEREEEERRRMLEEEEILATLEAMRLEEERQKHEAREQAEREYQQVLVVSCREECEAIRVALRQIIHFQQSTLASRHEASEHSHSQRGAESDARINWQRDKLTRALERNIANRKANMDAKGGKKLAELVQQLEEEEDAMFMQIQMHLRGKDNREAREKRMRTIFEQEQAEKRQKLEAEQQELRSRFQSSIQYEREGVNRAIANMVEEAKATHFSGMTQLGSQIGVERQWFELITARRIKMVEENERLMLQQLEANEEPVGLTVNQARDLEPLMPAFNDGALGPSGSRDVRSNSQRRSYATSTSTSAVSDLVESPDMYSADPNTLRTSPRQRQMRNPYAVELPGCTVVPPAPPVTTVAPPLTPPDSATPISSASSIVNHPPGAFPLSPRDSRDLSPGPVDKAPRSQPRFYAQYNSTNDDELSQAHMTVSNPIAMPRHAPPAVPTGMLVPNRQSPPLQPTFAGLQMPQNPPPPPPTQPDVVPIVARKTGNFQPQQVAAAAAREAMNTSPSSVPAFIPPITDRTPSPAMPDVKRPSITSSELNETSSSGRRRSSLFGYTLRDGKPKKEKYTDDQIRQMMKTTVGDAL